MSIAALQGNYNRAGLVELRTRRSATYAELDLSAGSLGLFDTQAALGCELERGGQLNLAAQHARGLSAAPSAAPGSIRCMKSWTSRCPAAGMRRAGIRPAI